MSDDEVFGKELREDKEDKDKEELVTRLRR